MACKVKLLSVLLLVCLITLHSASAGRMRRDTEEETTEEKVEETSKTPSEPEKSSSEAPKPSESKPSKGSLPFGIDVDFMKNFGQYFSMDKAPSFLQNGVGMFQNMPWVGGGQ